MLETVFAFILIPLDTPALLAVILFLALVVSVVLPIPEEATLILTGYLIYLGFLPFWPMVGLMILGVLVADSINYFIGRFAGERLHRAFFSRWMFANSFLASAQKYFARHGEKVVLWSRPFLGVRVAVPVLAGHFRMRFSHFFGYDALATIPWVWLLVSVSYYFGFGLDLLTDIGIVKFAIVGFVLLAFFAFAAVKFYRYKNGARS